MGGLFGGGKSKKAAAAAAAAAKRAAEQEKKRREAKEKRDQAYGARGQRLSEALGKEAAYSNSSGNEEKEKSNKLGDSALNYNLLNVKLG